MELFSKLHNLNLSLFQFKMFPEAKSQSKLHGINSLILLGMLPIHPVE
jgi:hypothetical protein